jgi:toxin ParE1/3/4
VKVVWTPEAQQDREQIWDFIVLDTPQAAIRMDELFSNAVAKLADFPQLGQPGKISGTRELIPHESYRIVYEIQQETVWI